MVCCSGVPSQPMMLDDEPSKDRPAKLLRARAPVPRHIPVRIERRLSCSRPMSNRPNDPPEPFALIGVRNRWTST